MVALQTTETVVPGSIPASLTQQKALRTGRVTVYAVKSQGGEGNLPLRQKELLVRLPILYYNFLDGERNHPLGEGLWIRIRVDPHLFSLLDPDPYIECGSGSRAENLREKQKKCKENGRKL